MSARRFLDEIWGAVDGDPALTADVRLVGEGELPSCFAVSDLAQGAVAAAALAAAGVADVAPRDVVVDRRLSSLWFGWTFQPVGWVAEDVRADVTGDYPARDGWVRLHANAPHHREAALQALGAAPDNVAVAVLDRSAGDVETAVVAAGGCAAAMRSLSDWAAHPQGQAVAAEPLVWRDSVACPAARGGIDPARPLAGIRVLDLTRVFAGPVCTRVLAGLGADVLRIDPLDWDEPGVIPEMTLGKRCARLDLRTPEGREQTTALLRRADVLVHGYRPGALDGLGLGTVERRRIRPELVDVSLDAWGWTGPWAGRRGFDSLVQMACGIADEGMRRFGTARPKPLPVQALDLATGYVMAAAALRGLAERRQGRAWTARTSLARVAALLTPSVGAGDQQGGIGKPGDRDFSSETEATAWGQMRRLRSPWQIAGAGLRWERGASPLGSAEARWL